MTIPNRDEALNAIDTLLRDGAATTEHEPRRTFLRNVARGLRMPGIAAGLGSNATTDETERALRRLREIVR